MCGASLVIISFIVCTSSLSSCRASIVLLGPTRPVQENSSLEFYCVVENSDNATIIFKNQTVDNNFEVMLTWSKDKGSIQSQNEDMFVQLVNLTGSSVCLTVCIQNVSYSHSGKYRCKSGEEISNEVDVTISKSTENFSSHYHRCLGQKSTNSSDKVTLTCISKTSSPKELKPKWFQNGSQQMQNDNAFNISLQSSDISFVSVETNMSTENVYTCQVNSGKENLSCSVIFPAFVSFEKYGDEYEGVFAYVSSEIKPVYMTKMLRSGCHEGKNEFRHTTPEEDSSSTTSTSTVDDLTTVDSNSDKSDNPNQQIIITSICFVYVGVSTIVFIIILVKFLRRRIRLWKLSHIYATFNPTMAPLAEIPRRNLSRRPTRSLPPIPTEEGAKPDAHYANAHLKLSQHSLPAHFRHSIQSFPSDSAMWKAGCRNSLPLHSSNVSAQNALYFFTETVEEGDEMKECVEEKSPVIPYTVSKSKPPPPKPFFKHHTLNVRSSTMVGKPRASDYQNWFQRFKLSTSCPSIAGMEQGEEVKPKPEIVCQAKSSFEKWKRRTQMRRRLSSVYRERTPPPAAPSTFFPNFRRPFSETFAQSENPYVERGTIPSCYSK